jgi:hypothetical protein
MGKSLHNGCCCCKKLDVGFSFTTVCGHPKARGRDITLNQYHYTKPTWCPKKKRGGVNAQS